MILVDFALTSVDCRPDCRRKSLRTCVKNRLTLALRRASLSPIHARGCRVFRALSRAKFTLRCAQFVASRNQIRCGMRHQRRLSSAEFGGNLAQNLRAPARKIIGGMELNRSLLPRLTHFLSVPRAAALTAGGSAARVRAITRLTATRVTPRRNFAPTMRARIRGGRWHFYSPPVGSGYCWPGLWLMTS